MTSVLLTSNTFLGLLMAESKLKAIPAEPWPLEGAIEALAGNPQGGHLAKTAKGWLAVKPSARGRVQGVARWARDACDTGLLHPMGEGWSAGFRLDAAWLEDLAETRASLTRLEQSALCDASQRLVAMASMLSKNAAA